MEHKINETVRIPLAQLEANDWNPNEQSAEVFNELVAEMEREGFDDPLLVVPIADGRYRIVGGEHRYHAAKMLGYAEAPCFIKEHWDERQQMIQTVRRNALRGTPDAAKLSRLVGRLAPNVETLPGLRLMLGISEEEWRKKVMVSFRPGREAVQAATVAAKDRMRTMENLAQVLNRIFTDYGDDVDLNFVFFMYGRKMHLMLEMGPKLKELMDGLVQAAREQKKDMNEIIVQTLVAGQVALALGTDGEEVSDG